MNTDEMRFGRLSEQIIGRAITVANALSVGFLEKVYENALAHELRRSGLLVRQQHGVRVVYDEAVVGEYTTDLMVNDLVIIELKVAKALDDVHRAQCLNYLRASGLPLCLLMNFGNPRLDVKRLVL